MCGIVGYKGKNENAIATVIEGLENLEYRGYDSAGIAYIKDNRLIITKETGRIKNLKSKLEKDIKSNRTASWSSRRSERPAAPI